jgi:hypothetical protein
LFTDAEPGPSQADYDMLDEDLESDSESGKFMFASFYHIHSRVKRCLTMCIPHNTLFRDQQRLSSVHGA